MAAELSRWVRVSSSSYFRSITIRYCSDFESSSCLRCSSSALCWTMMALVSFKPQEYCSYLWFKMPVSLSASEERVSRVYSACLSCSVRLAISSVRVWLWVKSLSISRRALSYLSVSWLCWWLSWVLRPFYFSSCESWLLMRVDSSWIWTSYECLSRLILSVDFSLCRCWERRVFSRWISTPWRKRMSSGWSLQLRVPAAGNLIMVIFNIIALSIGAYTYITNIPTWRMSWFPSNLLPFSEEQTVFRAHLPSAL